MCTDIKESKFVKYEYNYEAYEIWMVLWSPPNDLGELPQVIEDYLNLSRAIARV